MGKTFTRRQTLALLATPLVGAALAACGQKTEPDSCSDVSALSEGEKVARNALQYTDKSPQPDKLCSGCTYFTPGQPGACGACQLVKGPIHPKGYCTAFSAKT
jgi:hypothetical protein